MATSSSDDDSEETAMTEVVALRQELDALRRENGRLADTLHRRNTYIHDKVNQLLNVMGTSPLREEELDDDSIQEFDPLGIIFDSFRHILTSLKEKNSQLQLLHDEMVAIFSAAQVGIMVVDRDFRILSCNERMKEIFFDGLDAGTIFTACCKEVVCKGQIQEQCCAVSRILAGAETASFKGWEVHDHVFDVEAAPIHDVDGTVKRIVLVYNDITDLKQTQEELSQLNTQLEQRVVERTAQYQEINRELESFCYSVSHDLRAPLRHISGFTNILREDYSDSLNEDGRDCLQRICAVSEKMGRMIDDLLRISRVSRTTMNWTTVDLSNLAETTATMFREADPGREVSFRIAAGMTACGDATLLGIVLQNLIGNAWKYSATTREAVIEVGRTRRNGKNAYFVRDNGVGFDMTYGDKLFRVFERLHGEEFEGSGIGLATVQRIISRHRGEVWAESKIGSGATFYFTLPQNGSLVQEGR
jgi:PAS domain S-box-containing protein